MRLVPKLAERIPDRAFCAVVDRTYPRFEPDMIPIVDACDPDGIALDVGAWYGPWTRRLAGRLRRVECFEANPKVAAVLAGSIPSNVVLHRVAVSDRAGTVRFAAAGEGRGDEGTSHVVTEAGADAAGTIEVPAIALDDLTVADVRLIKIDVEGHEAAVVDGAVGLLEAWHPVLVIEIESRMSDVPATLERLDRLGYAGRVLHRGAWRRLEDFDLVAEQARSVPPASYASAVVKGRADYPNNVVFVHPSSTWAPWPDR